MRYLIISDCFYPETKSISRHIYDLLKEISNKNDHAILIFPKDINKKNNKKNLYIKNIKYLPIEIKEIKTKNFIQRGLKELILPYKILNLLKKKKIKVDKIIVFSPSIFLGLIFRKIKLIFKCKIVLIIRDVFPNWYIQKNKWQILNPLIWIAKIILKIQLNYSDIIATQSKYDQIKLKENNPKKKIITIYNWVTKKNVKQSKKCFDICRFVFVGTMGPAQNWVRIIDAIEILNYKNFIFEIYFIGTGSKLEFLKFRLKKLIEKKRVYFLNTIKEDKFIDYITKFTVGIISLDEKILFNNFPGKFYSYLESNLPILADVSPSQEISKIIKKNKLGLVSNPKNKNDLANKMEKFIKKDFSTKNLNIKYNNIYKKKFLTSVAYKKIKDC
jgi:O26-antigen biosynthesis N-acetyl-L-fucosamine transferase